jgi:multisubunit Na+/H+ antiporter MnhG subunit
MGTPQILLIILLTASVSLHFIKHGEKKVGQTYNVVSAMIEAAILVGLLWWGGFWG